MNKFYVALYFLILCIKLTQTVQRYIIETANYNDCDKVPRNVLLETLGEAFNERYMSITEPVISDTSDSNDDGVKRHVSGDVISFYVSNDYSREIEPNPNPRHIGLKNSTKFKRDALLKVQWDCEAVTKWIDLGEDYFPRFIRAVECNKNSCWYGQYKCVPKAFTIKVLKKRRDRCLSRYGEGLLMNIRVQLQELWVWEERGVTFCCDCVP